ncbi:MAG: anti-sigma factor [Brachybacterium sp.]|uniref:anti-sigma factor n=1 Tax=Brachybacterium sp. TaxID=1891286 RepID=UPI0026477D85|nr:anti-sigma factor [Brachybacterium sp.]MDN5686550.1 anti-sigma factor [Brachybacterium sp.]
MNEQKHDMTGAWALNALDADERARIEDYLAQDPEAAAEARSFEETAGELARGLEPAPPRPELKDSVMARIARTRQLPPHAEQDADEIATPSAPAENTHRGETQTSDAPAADSRDAQVVPLDRYRSAVRRTRWLAVAATALLVTSVAGVGLWSTERAVQQDAQETIEAMQSAQEDAAQEQQMVSTIMASDDATQLTVQPESGGALHLMYSRDQDAMIIQATDLADLPSGSTYQLWLIDEEGPHDAGLISASDQTVRVKKEMPEGAQLGLTVEPAGGSEQPTPPVIATGEL